MIDKELIKKINKILKKFRENESKIWNIDTDILKTWERFKNNLCKNFEFDSFDYKILKIIPVPHKDNKKINENYFVIEINKINITPRTGKVENGWSKSGVRQFLQEGSAFGIIMYSPGDNFDDGASFNISPKIARLLNDHGWGDLILASIKNSFFSCANHIKNFGLSLFIAYVINENENILEKMDEKIWFEWARAKRARKKTVKSFYSDDNLAIEYGKKIYDNTYKGLVGKMTASFSFEFAINYLYEQICESDVNNSQEYINYYDFNNSNFFDSKDLEYHLHKMKDYSKQLSTKRSKLRQLLLDARTKNNKWYSDIELFEEPHIDSLDAAHIFGVSSMKTMISNNLKKHKSKYENKNSEITEYASNVNNGLLLPSAIHRAFDRNTFQFNIDGHVIYQKENEELIKSLKIEKSKIKSNIINDEMILFLKMRVF